MHTAPPFVRRLVAAALPLLVAASAGVAQATTVLPLDLDAMARAAGRVFVGRVVAVRSGRDAHGFPVTWTTFAVDQSLKGTPTATLEIKQLGVEAPLPDGTIYRVPALPSYRVGDEVILFLHPESGAGFTSPVGLGQGRFRVHRHDGRAVAENDVGNANLRAATAAGGAGSSLAAPVANGGDRGIAVDDLLARVRDAIDATR